MSSGTQDHRSLLKQSFLEIERLQARLESLERAKSEPIAIVGVGCRFPGGGDDSASYWAFLRDGVDGITEIPSERWDIDALHDPNPEARWKMTTRRAAFLKDVDRFDAQFFGVSPREAASMDPQQRLLLEVAWEALEDAGVPASRLAGSRTGVFVGVCSNDYTWLQLAEPERIDAPYFGIGSSHNILAGRLSYIWDLRGPNVAIDTACSSSLVAVHLACQSLRTGESDMALAGGVNLILSPLTLIFPSKMHMLAPDGRCKAFDAQADGFSRGEGCGVVVLKRLSDALASGDEILAVIRGTSINQDGRTNGLTAPNVLSQQAVIRNALEDSGVEPERIAYVESHGTGTNLGDPAELEALKAVFGQRQADGPSCAIGSVKSNFGHLEAAAGIAGLIKAALAVKHGVIPPNLHFQTPNPNVNLEGTPFYVPTGRQPWPSNGAPRAAGVSAFGWSGTNAHVVLEEAPAKESRQESSLAPRSLLLPLSARNPEALRALAQRYRELLSGGMNGASLLDVCRAAAVKREQFDQRLAVVGEDSGAMIERLDAFLQGEARSGLVSAVAGERRGIVFVFPGQGSQWVGMGRQLLEREPAFRTALEACDRAMRPYVGWSALEVLAGSEGAPRLERIDVIQPILFAIEVALAATWRARGIEPDAVVGHSMGEVAAAHVAGTLSLDDAARIICRRSQLLAGLSGQGAMAVVELSQQDAERAIAGVEDRLSIAVCNGPRSTVLSGDPEALATVLATLQAQGVFCRQVKVDVASHSPQMEPLRPALLDALQGLQPATASVPIFSTVTGDRSDGAGMNAAYWVDNLRKPVLFSTAVRRLIEDGHTLFIEMSPHPILLPPVDELLRASGRKGGVFPSMRREEPEQAVLMESLGALYTRGHPIDWSRVFPGEGRSVKLPTYPFQRARYWNVTSPAGLPPGALLDGEGARFERPTEEEGASASEGGSNGIIASFYDSLVTQAAGEDVRGSDDNEHFLTWGVFPEIIPGFSWLRTVFRPNERPEDREHLAEAQRELRRVLFRAVDFSALRNVMDFGCGHGSDLIILGEQHEHLKLDGYTISGKQVEVCKQRVHARGLQNRIRIFQRDSAKDDFPGMYDLIIGFEVAGLIPDKDALFSNVDRHLTNGGLLIMADFVANTLSPIEVQETSTFSSTKEQWNKLLSSNHLRLVDAVDVSHEVANGLHNPDYAAQFEALCKELNLDELTQRSFASYENVYKALRAGLISYVLFHVQKDRFCRPEELFHHNAKQFEQLTPYSEFAARRDASGTNPADDETKEWLYEIQWRRDTTPAHRSSTSTGPGNWLILGDRKGVGEAVARRLEERGERCTLIHAGSNFQRVEDFQRLIQEVVRADSRPLRGVVHLWSLDGAPSQEPTLDTLHSAQQLGVQSALSVVQSLAWAGLRDAPRLWLVTAGTQVPGTETGSVAIEAAPLWGLGGTITQEHPELRCSRVDLSASRRPEEVDAFIETLWADGPEDQLALRGSERFVARLSRWSGTRARSANGEVTIRSDGTYLITGGFGGLGLTFARWLVDRGARHLILAGRNGAPESANEALAELRKAGAEVVAAKMDVADPEQVARVLEEARKTLPPLRGVIHSAVVLDDGVLLQQNRQRFESVMAPKVDGTWNLHRLTLDCPLDFFLLFSSLASMLGAPGQGNYTAAGAFQDAFVFYRRSLGLPAMTINWSPWSDVGQAVVHANRGERLAQGGLQSINPAQGVRVLERLLAHTPPQIGVMRLDLRQWRQFYPRNASSPLFAELMRTPSAAKPSKAASDSSIRASLQALEPGPRRRAMLEEHLQSLAAQVLRMSPDQLDRSTPLRNLGFDSLVAVEFRNRIEASLGLTLSATLVWNHPTIEALATHLADKMGLALSVAEAPSKAEQRQDPLAAGELQELAEGLLDELEGLSNDESGRLLDGAPKRSWREDINE
ncbi:SDR family NAD(P)-dependent oxidoreductase [Archangium violaceum]|uniref:type I polyketide synthase n=1 Tax=Archangium violaceum TaxID=83451 RepID=UPI002B2C95E5|nr:SDR family NAD(P)-dependent oxidoreductase [Archangium violaceum]